MAQCAYCGFVNSTPAPACGNCGSPIEDFFGPATPTVETSAGYGFEDATYQTRRARPRQRTRSIVPLKTILVLVIIALFFLPQTQPYTDPVKDRITELWEDLSTPYFIYPKQVEFTIERHYTISMPSGRSGSYELTLHHPYAGSPYAFGEPHSQQLVKMKISPAYTEGEAPNSMVWSGNLSGGTSMEVKLTYTAIVDSIDAKMDASRSGTIDQIPTEYTDRYLGAEWLIEPENENVQALATQLKANTGGNVYLILENIFDYIMDNFQYQVGKDAKTCDQTLNKGYGDCDDLGILFASIARAAGIPVWLELGILSQEGFTSWTGHAWTNVVIPLVEDGQPAGHMIGVVDLANGYFLWMPPFRFTEWISDGNGDHIQSYYQYFSGTNGADISSLTVTVDYTTTGEEKRPVE